MATVATSAKLLRVQLVWGEGKKERIEHIDTKRAGGLWWLDAKKDDFPCEEPPTVSGDIVSIEAATKTPAPDRAGVCWYDPRRGWICI